MPLTRIGDRLIYFAHVPKCGGTSVEQAFRDLGHEWGFLAGGWKAQGASSWVRSVPQHLPADALERLFPPGFFDYRFALVRDPVDRFLSAVNHNRQNGNLPWWMGLGGVLRRLEARSDHLLHRCDNHFLPACRFLPPGTEVFRLEDGMEGLCAALAREVDPGFATLPFGRANARRYNATASPSWWKARIKAAAQPRLPARAALDPATLGRIAALYAEDYEALGYARPEERRPARPGSAAGRAQDGGTGSDAPLPRGAVGRSAPPRAASARSIPRRRAHADRA